ncbi:MAG: acyl-CoA dehydrogenase family protein, partial [Gammaproteobacteria bacterium]|nr:acyl-CoA dehydrogenase family protein [Gammaproteobacteria bacterium]
MSLLLNPRDIEFVLYELLDTEALVQTERYGAHDRETFNVILDAARRLAEEKFAPNAAKVDANEPTFDGERVHHIPEIHEAVAAYIDSGFM